MRKHPSGPWAYGGYEVIAGDDTRVCGISGWRGPQVTKANAQLIAAAPELMESLKLAKLCIEAMIEDGRCGETFVGAALTLDKINFAIAQAEGGQ